MEDIVYARYRIGCLKMHDGDLKMLGIGSAVLCNANYRIFRVLLKIIKMTTFHFQRNTSNIRSGENIICL